jgi:hypothetical protein
MYSALQNSVVLRNYLKLFPSIDRADVEEAIMTVVAREHDKNTLGIRLLNTLINQYFINDGKLLENQTKQTTFQTSLSFKVAQ